MPLVCGNAGILGNNVYFGIAIGCQSLYGQVVINFGVVVEVRLKPLSHQVKASHATENQCFNGLDTVAAIILIIHLNYHS